MGESPPITFAGAGLDRAPAERRNADWLAERRRDERAGTLLISEQGVRVERDEHGARLALAAPSELAGEPLLLGLAADGRPLFAIDTGELEQNGLPGAPLGLRELASELPERELGLVAYAAALLNWHRRHGFCAVCGNATDSVDGGHERRCPACGAHHFPRTDPVVIMCVTRGDQLLLGHQAAWPAHRYSVLAGFVEPGETLEQAVRREVLEESGIELEHVGYVASQPWPFPSSLMLGFQATARPGREPEADGDELEDVRWFTRDDVRRAAADESELLLAARALDRAPADRRLAGLSRLSGRGGLGTRRRSSRAACRARRRSPRSMASPPPASRSSTLTTPTIVRPSSRMRSIAATVEPPVVTTSSTTRQRSPGSSSGPSTQRWSPCCLRSLRTKNAFTGAPAASAAQATGSAPIVSPPTAVAPSRCASAATSSPSARKPAGSRIARLAST